jgi:electron transfer flavoprotein alpha subunit
MTSLVIAEHDNASIKGSTLNTVTAALQCGGDVHVLVAGSNAGAAAAAAAQIAGVAKVLHADSDALAHGLAENMTAQVVALAGSYSHILFPATASGGKNVAPRVAAKLDVGQISDITKVEAADTFERPIYAGNAMATVQSQTPSRWLPCAPPTLTPQLLLVAVLPWKAWRRSQPVPRPRIWAPKLPRTTAPN